MRENEFNTVDERLFNFSAGCHCGVFMPEHVMKRIAKLNAKYSQDIRHILNDNKSDIYSSHWTLSYPIDDAGNPKQTTVYYIRDDENEVDVSRRIKLFTAPFPEYQGEVYRTSSYEDARDLGDRLSANSIPEIPQMEGTKDMINKLTISRRNSDT